MASIGIIQSISISIILLSGLIPASQTTNASPSGIMKLLSLLSEKLHTQNQPVIIIVDEKHEPFKRDKPDPVATDTSDEDQVVHLAKHLLAHDKARGPPLQLKKSTKSLPFAHEKKYKQKYRAQKIREGHGLEKVDRDVLRSPIVKKLLRISNSLRCEAKNECQDKCLNKYFGKKIIKCKIQCSVKYICEKEEQEEKDPCVEEDCRDSCGGSDECKHSSTRGEKYVTEKPGCVRC